MTRQNNAAKRAIVGVQIRSGFLPSCGASAWGTCVQVDTFEAVKNNVYSVLGDLAKDLAGPELDLLFSKFEACIGWPAPDALKAMDLLKQLAKSDAMVRLPAWGTEVLKCAESHAVLISLVGTGGVDGPFSM